MLAPLGAEQERGEEPAAGSGGGGDEIARDLAGQLGVEIYDEEILDGIAKHANVNPSLLEDLHEKVSRASDSWLYSVIFGESVSRDDYLRYLVTTVRGLYRMGGIIKGRGGSASWTHRRPGEIHHRPLLPGEGLRPVKQVNIKDL